MKCDCIERIEKELQNKSQDIDKLKGVENIGINCENIAFVCGDDNVFRNIPYLNFVANGVYTTKSGNQRVKKVPIPVTFTYCPYCGKKLTGDENEKAK